jgi:hypothetical protein
MFHTPPLRTWKAAWSPRVLSVIGFGIPGAMFLAIGLLDHPVSIPAAAFGAALVLIGLALAAWLGIRFVAVHPEGVRVRGMLKDQALRWEEIAVVRHRMMQVQVHGHGLLGWAVAAAIRKGVTMAHGPYAGFSHTLKLESADGRKAAIGSSWESIGTVLRRVQPRLLGEALATIKNGGGVKFGDLTLTEYAVQWKKKEPVPFNEIKEIALIQGQFVVRRNGKMMAAISSSALNIPNAIIAIDCLRQLGLPVTAGLDPQAPGLALGD